MAYGYDPLSAFQAGIDAENKGYWTPIANAQKAAKNDFAFLEDARNAPLRALQTDIKYASGEAALEDFGNQRMAGDIAKTLQFDEDGNILDEYSRANKLMQMAGQQDPGVGSILSEQARNLFKNAGAQSAIAGDYARAFSSLKGAGIISPDVGFRFNPDTGTATVITGEGDLRQERVMPLDLFRQNLLDLSTGKGALQSKDLDSYYRDLESARLMSRQDAQNQGIIERQNLQQQSMLDRQLQTGRLDAASRLAAAMIREGGSGASGGANTLNLGAIMAGASGSPTPQPGIPAAQLPQSQGAGQYIVPALQPSGGRTTSIPQQAIQQPTLPVAQTVQQQVMTQTQPAENPNDPAAIYSRLKSDADTKAASLQSAEDLYRRLTSLSMRNRVSPEQLDQVSKDIQTRRADYALAKNGFETWYRSQARQPQIAPQPFVLPKY